MAPLPPDCISPRPRPRGGLWWLATGKSQFVRSAMKCHCISTGARHSTSEKDDFMKLMKLSRSQDPRWPVSQWCLGQRYSLATKGNFKIIWILVLIKTMKGIQTNSLKSPFFSCVFSLHHIPQISSVSLFNSFPHPFSFSLISRQNNGLFSIFPCLQALSYAYWLRILPKSFPAASHVFLLSLLGCASQKARDHFCQT